MPGHHNFIMRYNELTYHKANPFYKQDYLPDRAWYNRKPKEYASQIPSGQEYFTDNGRKHYQERFNHSEIQETGVLKSPEKYPYQNRIALEKTYMRSLDTTDIEGAGSGTRVNEAVRNKLRAQEQLARKHNQSLDLRDHKQHEYQEKRRQLAIKQYQNFQLKNSRINTYEQPNQNTVVSNNPQSRKLQAQNPSLQPALNSQNESMLKQYQYGDPYAKLTPKINDNLEYTHKEITPTYSRESSINTVGTHHSETISYTQPLSPSDRHRSNPSYINHYDSELQRRKQQYMKTIEMDSMARSKLSDKKQFRKFNPTNLSFNLAGQNIVAGGKS